MLVFAFLVIGDLLKMVVGDLVARVRVRCVVDS